MMAGLLNLELNFLSEKIAKLNTTGQTLLHLVQTWCEANGFSEHDCSSIQIIVQIFYLSLYLFSLEEKTQGLWFPIIISIFCIISNLNFRKSPVPNVKTGWDAFPLWWELMNLPLWSIMTFLAQFSVTIPPMFQLQQMLNAKVKINQIFKNTLYIPTYLSYLLIFFKFKD